jgi:hypothetical protein
VIFSPSEKSFGNLGLGPVISIEDIEQKQDTLENLLGRGLIVTAFITDKKHPVYKMFMESDAITYKEPVAVIITTYYLQEYYS